MPYVESPPWKVSLFEDCDFVTQFGEFSGAGETRGTGSDHGHCFARCSSGLKDIQSRELIDVIRRETLQSPDHDRLVFGSQNTRSFAELLYRANACASGAEKIGLENRSQQNRSRYRSRSS